MSLKSLKGRRLRSWLTMIGIFIGIAAVVSLISLGEGLQNAVVGQFNLAGADVITITASGVQFGPPGSGVVTPLTKSELEAVRRVRGVDNAFGRVIETGTAEFNNQVQFGYAGSLPEGVDESVIYDLINIKADKGRTLQRDDHGKVALGSDFLNPDLFGKPLSIGSNILIEGQSFEVVGIMKKKGSFVVDSIVFMTEDDIRTLFNTEKDTYDLFIVQAQKGIEIEKLKQDIEKVLRKERNVNEGEENFIVQTNKAAVESLESTLFGVQLFVYIIASISLIVGGLGITNTMYTAVIERKKDIGIMKAIGARNSTIFYLFFIESGLLGSVGGIIGVSLGSAIALGTAFIGRQALGTDLISAHISPELVISALLFSFIIGTVAGITPAMRAARLNPVDALRG